MGSWMPSLGFLAPLVLVGAACARTPAGESVPNQPAVACHSEAAMLKWMASDKASKTPNDAVLKRLLASHDCLYVPYESVTSIGFPAKPDGAAKITVKTSKGVEHLWGYPVGE